jgi:hypothetical protein
LNISRTQTVSQGFTLKLSDPKPGMSSTMAVSGVVGFRHRRGFIAANLPGAPYLAPNMPYHSGIMISKLNRRRLCTIAPR